MTTTAAPLARITRTAPGVYSVTATCPGRDVALEVRVVRLAHLTGPQWVADLAGCPADPDWTLADAKRTAAWMLADAAALDGQATEPLAYAR